MTETIERALGRIEAKLDHAIAVKLDHEKRLTAAEHTITRAGTLASVAGVVGSALWAAGTHLLGRTA